MASLLAERQEAFNTARPHLEYLSRRELAALFPQVEQVRSDWEFMAAGIAVESRMEALRAGTPSEAKMRGEDSKLFKEHLIWTLDGFAATRLMRGFQMLDYRTYVEDCEGHKEKKASKLGRAPIMLRGYYGPEELKEEVDVNLDPIEGTEPTADNKPGGMVFGAMSTPKGIMPTPVDEKSLGGNGEEIDYMDKLFAPPRLKGEISLEQTPLERLVIAQKIYGLDPSQIVVTYLNRPRNQHIIDAINEFGARHNPIPYGDLAPSLRACREPGEDGLLHLVEGSGGWQEGIGAAAAGKAWGAVAEGRIVRVRQDGEKEVYTPDARVLAVNDLIPGEPEHSMAIFAAITDIPEFGMRGVDLENYKVATFAVDLNKKEGFRIQVHDIRELLAA